MTFLLIQQVTWKSIKISSLILIDWWSVKLEIVVAQRNLYVSAVSFVPGSLRPMASTLALIQSFKLKKLPFDFFAKYKKTIDQMVYSKFLWVLDSINNSGIMNHERGCLNLSKFNFGYLETHQHTFGWSIKDKISELAEMLWCRPCCFR